MVEIFKRKKVDKKKAFLEKIFRYLNFFIGCLLISIAFNLFLAKNNLIPGGVAGIAIILKELFNINNSITVLISGVILLIVSYFALGKEQTKYSVVGTILFPILIHLTRNIGEVIPIDTSELLLSAIFGGVINGFGLGMIFKAGFTTGGTDIINQILSKYFHMSIGKSMIFSDGLIVLISAFVFGPVHFMYSIIVLYIISLMSDKVILGISDSKAFFIVTEKDDEIKRYILKDLGRGATIFKAKGGFNEHNKNVLMCVIPTKEYYRLKTGINMIDEKAFFVVTDAYEVFGGE